MTTPTEILNTAKIMSETEIDGLIKELKLIRLERRWECVARQLHDKYYFNGELINKAVSPEIEFVEYGYNDRYTPAITTGRV